MISKITAIIMAIVSMISNLAGVLPSRQVMYYDVSYGSHERQIMDICFPADAGKTEGVVLFLHGGGWVSGDKSSYDSRIQSISKSVGCISVTMNYRYLSKDINCIDILNDIDSALTKIKSMAETRGINCDKVMLVGASAGAHLAMLYSYAKKNSAPIKPCAVASYSGPANLASENFINNNTFAPPETMAEIMSYLTGVNLLKATESQKTAALYKFSPIKYLSSDSVPTLIVHGTLDTVVDINDTYKFVKALKSNEIPYKFIELPDSGHALDNDNYLMSKSDKVFVDFVNMFLK